MALIKGKQLADQAISAAKLADSSVSNAKLEGNITPSKLDLSQNFAFTGAVTLPTPTQDSHAVTKSYVDGKVQGLDVKESVKRATTGVLAVSSSSSVNVGNGTITLASGDGGYTQASGKLAMDGGDAIGTAGTRVLIKDGININSGGLDNTVNGIYTLGALGGATLVLTRAEDSNTSSKLSPGSFTFVEQGTTNGDKGFVANHDINPTLGTTDIGYTQFSSASAVTAGDGLLKTGSEIRVLLDSNSGLAISANGTKMDVGTLLGASSVTVASDSLAANISGSTQSLSISTLVSGMQGAGLSASSGTLAVNTSATGGLELSSNEVRVNLADTSLAADGTGLKVNLHSAGSIAIKTNGIAAPIIAKTDLNQNITSNVSTDDTDTGLTITNTPAAGGMVRVYINGIVAELGDNAKDKDCYFSGDSGTNARALESIQSGDSFYWNGASTYTLETSDLVDFVYASI